MNLFVKMSVLLVSRMLISLHWEYDIYGVNLIQFNSFFGRFLTDSNKGVCKGVSHSQDFSSLFYWRYCNNKKYCRTPSFTLRLELIVMFLIRKVNSGGGPDSSPATQDRIFKKYTWQSLDTCDSFCLCYFFFFLTYG